MRRGLERVKRDPKGEDDWLKDEGGGRWRGGKNMPARSHCSFAEPVSLQCRHICGARALNILLLLWLPSWIGKRAEGWSESKGRKGDDDWLKESSQPSHLSIQDGGI